MGGEPTEEGGGGGEGGGEDDAHGVHAFGCLTWFHT